MKAAIELILICGILREGLCLSFRLDQHVVGDVFEGDGDAEQGAEGGVSGAAAIEAESELVEIGLQVLLVQPVIDAERPALKVCQYRMNSPLMCRLKIP